MPVKWIIFTVKLFLLLSQRNIESGRKMFLQQKLLAIFNKYKSIGNTGGFVFLNSTNVKVKPRYIVVSTKFNFFNICMCSLGSVIYLENHNCLFKNVNANGRSK